MEINKIYNEDCLVTLSKMEDNSVDLIVTSPPYNKNYWILKKNKGVSGEFIREIKYDSYEDSMQPDDYNEWQKNILKECQRVIKSTGSIFYNHIDILHKNLTIHPTFVYDFPIKQIIVWDRMNTPKLSKHYFFPQTEWIFWIKKNKKANPYFNKNNAYFQKSVWKINRSMEKNHPAPFPDKLVENIILSCSKEGDVVYDPFMGSGTTYKVGRKLNRNVIGSEISEEYIKLSESKVNNHEFF